MNVFMSAPKAKAIVNLCYKTRNCPIEEGKI